MTSSQLGAAAQQAGTSLHTVASSEALIDAWRAEAAALVVLDLTAANLDCAAVVRALGEEASVPPPQILAFGPHVHEQRLAAAQAAGCDEVLSRGQMFREAGERFGQYAD